MSELLAFGQLIIGPPGSGKSTYTSMMADLLTRLGRPTYIINIDPGNEKIPYKASINITNLITLEDAMEKNGLGPNGGFLFAMEYLELNIDWLVDQIKTKCFGADWDGKNYPYLIFDCPGQVELFIHHDSLKNVVSHLVSKKTSGLDLRLCCVNLVDSFYANDPGKFIAAMFNSLSTMLHFELPHVNILSKMDLIEKYGKVDFNIDYYCDVMDLSYLFDRIIDDPFMQNYKNLSKELAGLIESYSLVSFIPLDCQKPNTVVDVLKMIDRANGHYLLDPEKEEKLKQLYDEYQKADFEYAKLAQWRELLSTRDIGDIVEGGNDEFEEEES